MRKKQNKKANLFIRVLVSIILIFAACNSLVILSLGFFGKTVTGVLDSYDSRRDDGNAGQNQSRTISKSYHFSVDGKEYSGWSFYNSDEAWPSIKAGEVRTEKISYLAFLPVINKPAMLTDYNEIGDWGMLYYLMSIPLCILLFLLVNGWLHKKKRRKNKPQYQEPKKCTNREKEMMREDALCPECKESVDKPV